VIFDYLVIRKRKMNKMKNATKVGWCNTDSFRIPGYLRFFPVSRRPAAKAGFFEKDKKVISYEGKGVECVWEDVRDVSNPLVVHDPVREFISNQHRKVAAQDSSVFLQHHVTKKTSFKAVCYK
jgi:hypothetical protein